MKKSDRCVQCGDPIIPGVDKSVTSLEHGPLHYSCWLGEVTVPFPFELHGPESVRVDLWRGRPTADLHGPVGPPA